MNLCSIKSFEFKNTREGVDIFTTQDTDESLSLNNLVKAGQRKSSSLRSLQKMCAFNDEEEPTELGYGSEYFEDNVKLSKYRIIATVDKLDHTSQADYDGYYTRLVKSKVDIIKFSLSIYDDTSFDNLKQTYDKMVSIMALNNIKIPIMISMQYRILRLRIDKATCFKKGQKLFIRISNHKTIDEDSKLYGKDCSNVYFINNEDYFYSKRAELGDKFMIDFGKGLFTITKIIYKNGKMLEMNEDDIEKEIKESSKIYITNNLFTENLSNENIDEDLQNMVNQYYGGNEVPTVKNLSKDGEIDYMEVVVNYDCTIPHNRLVQLWKKSICLFIVREVE
jgi:hypothetical protein